jgi:[ribosomal protein S5]-alanine N-acetyltransferase
MSLFRLAFGAGDEAIHGEKVLLRYPRMADFEAWKALRLSSRAFLEPWEPTWTEDEFTRRSFRNRVSVYSARAESDEGYSFFLFEKATGALAGGMTLSHVRRGVSQAATLGYWMGQPFAGRGLMKDGLMALLACASGRWGLHRIEAACIPTNEPSRRLLLACGFEAEGFAKAYVKIADRWQDHLLFGRLVDGQGR